MVILEFWDSVSETRIDDSNPNLILYACIAKGSIILGEFFSKEPEISETLAQECVEKTPPHHSLFSHTVGKRTYTFVIDDHFTYFSIVDESLEKSESLWFLNRVKSAFEEFFKSWSISDVDNVGSRCFQAKFDAVCSELMDLDLEFLNGSRSGSKDGRNPSMDSAKEGAVVAPLLGKPSNGLKKKKRLQIAFEREVGNGDVNEEKKVDVCDDVSMQKNALHAVDRQKAKQIWKKHVWIVLGLDLIVCAILFGIWLWVCRGFQCIDG